MKRRTFFRSTLTAAAALSISRREALAAAFKPVSARPQDLQAVTGDGRTVTLSGKAIADLRARLKGRLLLAGDDGYDDARRILEPSFDKRPAVIAQVTGAADVGAAVNFARDNGGLLVAVKCGGHSSSGKSTCDRGLMIDLSPFRNVRVDPIAKTARVTGGSLLGQLDHESMAHDLVTTMGTVSHTGVGGLVTGGGFGRLGRRFGLSIDSLLSVDVISADGKYRRASADENPDLFWGVRGGGGNFGVVTSFEFRLHPMQRQVSAGRIMFPLEMARDVLVFYGEYGPGAPDELQLDFGMFMPPGGQPGMVGFSICHSGAPGRLDGLLAPIRKLGTPMVDQVEAMDYVALQRSGDIDDPRAMGSYLKSGFISSLSPDLATAIAENFRGHPTRFTQVFFQQGGGAISRVASAATAFAQRDTQFNMLSAVGWTYGDDPTAHIEWIKQYWTHLEPFTSGFYVNDLEVDHTAAAVRANFRQNHDRLVQVKNTYDPNNLFRLNANVLPTG